MSGGSATGQCGDLAAGGGYLGEIVDLPSGMVGLALLNEHGWERRIVYVPADDITVVKLAQDRPHLPELREQEFRQLTAAHVHDLAQKPPAHGW